MSKKSQSRPAAPTTPAQAPSPAAQADLGPVSAAAPSGTEAPSQAPGAEGGASPSAPSPAEPAPATPPPALEAQASPTAEPEPEPTPKFKAFLAITSVGAQGFRRFGHCFGRNKKFIDPATLTDAQLLEFKRLSELKVLAIEVSYQPQP